MHENSLFRKLGCLLFQFKKSILLLWVVITIALLVVGLKLPSILGGSGFEMDGEFNKVNSTLQNDFNTPKSSIILLFESKSFNPNDEPYKSFVNKTLDRMKDVDHVSTITSPYEATGQIKDHTAYATLSFNKGFDDLKPSIKQIKTALKNENGITVKVTGGPVIADDMNTASQKDLAKAELIGMPVALFVLILAFGSLISAGIPLLIGLISVACSMGTLYLLGQAFDLNLSVFLLNVVPMIGLALGIDFALLLVSRFKEELTRHPLREAVVKSVETAGRSIAFSGICVFLGLSGMLFIDIDIFKTVAIGGMVVVIFSVLTAIIFLPTVLGLLGERINKFTIIKVKESKQTAWYQFASFVMKRPVVMLISTLTILIMAMTPILNIRFSIPDADALPKSYDSRIAFEQFEKSFGGNDLYPLLIVVESKDNIMTEKSLNQLNRYIQTLKKESMIKRVDSIFTYTKQDSPQSLLAMYHNQQAKPMIEPALKASVNGNKTVVRAYLNVDSDSKQAKDWLREQSHTYQDLHVMIGGNTRFYQEIFDEIVQKVPYGATLIFVSTFIILLLAFRSVLIPLKAIIMNIVSLSATFGILVYLFQEGHLGPATDIALMIPVFTFGIVFGLSMDYEVFLISRIQEMYLETGNNDEATLFGLTRTSKIITSAALIMIVITGAFAFTGIMPVKQMGVAVALAIFIDATLVRMILVPSLMRLLGKWNWWAPKFLKSKHAQS